MKGGPRNVYREGTFATGGLEGTFRVWSTAAGAFRTESKAAGYADITAVRGGVGWTQGGSGQPHDLEGPELQAAIADAWMANPAALAAEVVRGEAARTLVVTPTGGKPLTIEIDPASCLPAAVRRQDRDRTTTTTIQSWTVVDGIPFPVEMVQSTGDPKYDVYLKYTATRLDEPVESAMFEPAARELALLPEGLAFAAMPFELTQNHIYVRGSVNGKDPTWFLIDTGADFSVIETSHAAKIGLETKGAIEARGSGEGSVDAGIVESARLQLGELNLLLEAMFTAPFTPIWLREGRAIEGIVGYNVLGHFVVEFDYAGRTLRLHDPRHFTPPSDADAVPITFDGNVPAIVVAVSLPDGRRVEPRLILDTGARGAVTLSRPFIEKHGIREAAGPMVRGPLGLGVGGASTSDIGRIAEIQLGPHVVKSPVTSFSLDRKGAGGSPDVDGIIGGEILRRFTVWVDYPGKRVLLRPNGSFGEPFEYDMSGLLIEAADPTFQRIVIRNVLEGSPAAEAGVRVGDELVSIDGERAGASTLEQIRRRLTTPGQAIALTLLRDGARIEVVVMTRRMV
jgi:predicted aspartyl protease